jgi:hypothetical protein
MIVERITEADFTDADYKCMSLAIRSGDGVIVAQLDIDDVLIARDGLSRVKSEVARWLSRLTELGILK